MTIGLGDKAGKFSEKQMGTTPNTPQNASNERQHKPQAMSQLSHEPRFTSFGRGSRTSGSGGGKAGGHVAQD